MLDRFLLQGSPHARFTILLAHGAGAPMDSASMTAAADALAGVGFRIARFEFAYMAARRTSEGRKPPPRDAQSGIRSGDCRAWRHRPSYHRRQNRWVAGLPAWSPTIFIEIGRAHV